MNLVKFPVASISDPGGERNVLACVIKSQDAWIRLPHNFDSDAFFAPLNKAIWTVVDNLYAKGAAIDPIVVHESLPSQYQQELEELGGWAYVQTLHDLPIDPANVGLEATKLLELSTRRRIEKSGSKILSLARDTVSLDKIREKIELALGEIDRDDDEALNIATKGTDYIERKMSNPTPTPGLPSGFENVDRSTQGFQSGRLYVVGARKKTGKSMILLNWAKHIAVDLGIPVLWISTEHTIDDEYSRLLSLTSNVHESSINNGTFSEVEAYVERVADSNEKIGKSPFYFSSMPFFTLDKIRRLTRKMVRVHGVKILFFDYIKAPEGDNHAKEWQELGAFTFGLKSLGNTEGIPVVTACQVNREGQQSFRENGEIDSDYFAGSDRIAQAVSVSWILRKPTDREVTDPDQFRVLRCTDNRHGSTNLKLLLDFHGETSELRENRRL